MRHHGTAGRHRPGARPVAAIVVAGLILAGCSGSATPRTRASSATSSPPATEAPSATSGPPATEAPSATSGPLATTPSARSAPATAPPHRVSFAAIAGNYLGGTADGGGLYVRADGAARFRYPDSYACPGCTTATDPIGTVDFTLNSLAATGPGAYIASGRLTAESDPRAFPALRANSPITISVGGSGLARLSFVNPYDTLHRSSTS